MRILQILALIFGLAILANAQDTSKFTKLSGKVLDKDRKPAKVSVYFILNEEKFRVFLNDEGKFELNIPSGLYNVEMLWCFSVVKKISQIEVKGKKQNFEFVLERQIPSEKEVICHGVEEPGLIKTENSFPPKNIFLKPIKKKIKLIKRKINK